MGFADNKKYKHHRFSISEIDSIILGHFCHFNYLLGIRDHMWHNDEETENSYTELYFCKYVF